jgi:hypothetical protein
MEWVYGLKISEPHFLMTEEWGFLFSGKWKYQKGGDMALISCKECGKEVSSEAKKCPI